MAADYVTRYVPTYIDAEGRRTLMRRQQGRDTFATPREAQRWIDAVMSQTQAACIALAWGTHPQPQVRACACHAGHFDPVGIWFDTEPDPTHATREDLDDPINEFEEEY